MLSPRGNSNYGRSSDATYETGTRTDGGSPGGTAGTPRTLTGTGPASWRHNNDFAGIADLAGNVWEWASGLRLNNGEIQVLANNDAALATADLSSASADWRAISMTDGSLVLPGSAGTGNGNRMGAAQDPGVKKICVVEERSLTRGLLFALCAPGGARFVCAPWARSRR